MESTRLQERDWDLLMRRIRAGKCTPFLGAGAAYGVLPLGSQIAQEWAQQFKYPLADTGNLARVATFLAVQYDPMYPKEALLRDWFQNPKPPDYTNPTEPHATLASLPLPMYMTTNYDRFMTDALKAAGKRPRRELCRWNKLIKECPSIFDKVPDFEPNPEEPIVFHLHGHDEYPESLVLTEEDYLDFLVSISKDDELLPHQVRRYLASTSLLFVGYSLADWSFRVLFRGLVSSVEQSLRRISLTVQLPPLPDGHVQESSRSEIQSYLAKYFDQIDIRVYWGTAQEFMSELRTRWEAFQKSNG
ncbi:MAG TPA: SIR2 family protein [Anaerolineales bacterium]|nr:SIR2 family protein [Anaerolineales bacterium]